MQKLKLGNREFTSRLFVGTGKYSSNEIMRNSILSSASELITVALKRFDPKNHNDDMIMELRKTQATIMPNTSGARDAKEAIFASQLAREALETDWIKLEIHPNPNHLLPDSEETLKAAKELAKDGFIVLPYINADPILCKKLEDVGCAAVMPLGSPIGTNLGLETRKFLEIIIKDSFVPVVVDAGIGRPSHASEAMEMGADAVLVNTAIASAEDPILMGQAFKQAVEAGRLAFEAGLPTTGKVGASSPFTEFISDL